MTSCTLCNAGYQSLLDVVKGEPTAAAFDGVAEIALVLSHPAILVGDLGELDCFEEAVKFILLGEQLRHWARIVVAVEQDERGQWRQCLAKLDEAVVETSVCLCYSLML